MRSTINDIQQLTEYYNEMKLMEINPDTETFRILVQAFHSSKSYADALRWNDEAIANGLQPDTRHLVLSCWCRTGQVDRAIESSSSKDLVILLACVR
jgi:hypothetical protein